MAFIPVPNCAEVVINGDYFSNPMLNVLNFRSAGGVPYTTATLTDLATIVLSAWDTFVMPLFCESYTLVDVKATDLSSASGPSVTLAPSSPAIGGLTTPGLPGSVALCMTHRTGSRGRSFRGRTYFGALVEPLVVGNQVDGAHMIALLTAWGSFLTDVEGSGHQFVIASRYENNAPRTTGISTLVTTSAWRDGNVDSQRRRSQT